MKRKLLALALALAVVVFGCTDWGDFYPLDGCMPGSVAVCYNEPAGTLGQGICPAGTKTCNADGVTYGPCMAPSCKGDLVWAKSYAGSGSVADLYPTGIATDSKGNILITGWYEDVPVDFGGGPLSSGSSGHTMFVVKLNAAGGHVWSKGFGDDHSQANAYGMAVDSTGNVIITGYSPTAIDLGGGPLMSGDFLAKFDANGKHLWSRRVGGELDQGICDIRGVAVDSRGNISITGVLRGSVDLGGEPLVSAGDADVFLAHFDANGKHLWSKRFGDWYYQEASNIAVDSMGNIIILGYFWGTLEFGGLPLAGPGNTPADIFLAKFDASGKHLWSRQFGSLGLGFARPLGVTTGDKDSILFTGWLIGQVDFGGGLLVSAGWEDILLAKFSADGEHLWSKRFGDITHQSGVKVATDSAGNVLLTGWFCGQVDFGGGPLVSAGCEDIFLAKLVADGSHLWSKRSGDITYQDGFAVTTDSGQNVLLLGGFVGQVDFGGGPLAGSMNSYTMFVAKFNP